MPPLFALLLACAPSTTVPSKGDDTAACAPTSWHRDADGDGFGDPDAVVSACEPGAGLVADATDCDDGAAGVYPGAEEIWYDGADEDCAGDDDFDQDGDGHDRDHDCDDTDPALFPDETVVEVWYNGIDENCDGNDGDQDGDGWYIADYRYPIPVGYAGREGDCWDDPAATTGWAPLNGLPALTAADVHPGAADAPYDGLDADCAQDPDFDADRDGFASDRWPDATGQVGDDCDDAEGAVHPGAEEIWYDGVDGDCAGDADDDQDHDGHTLGADCDDVDAGVHPGAVEDCATSVDEDCDGSADGATMSNCERWYADADGDGHGTTASVCTCAAPVGYGSTTSDDCDDAQPDVHPGAAESCDGVDEDCDGVVDDGAASFYLDNDGDGEGAGAGSCTSTGRVTTGTDCDDTDPAVWTGAPELCDERRNDCADTAWTLAYEAGVASFEGASGWTDVSDLLAAGSSTSPAALTVAVGGSLHVCPGTWYVLLTAGAGLGEVTVDAPHGAGTVTLDGASMGRVISASGPGTSVVLDGLVLAHGNADNGGAVASSAADLTITDCTLRDSVATGVGGALATDGASVTTTGLTASGNLAGTSGGAFFVQDGDHFVSDSTFEGNAVLGGSTGEAVVGGALAWLDTAGGSSLVVEDSSFDDNELSTPSGDAGGGAIFALGGGSGAVTLTRDVVVGGRVDALGIARGGAVAIVLSGSAVGSLTDVDLGYSYAAADDIAEGGALSVLTGSAAGLSVSGGAWTQSAVYSDGSARGGLLAFESTDGGAGLDVVGTELSVGFVYDGSGVVAGAGGCTWTYTPAQYVSFSGVDVSGCGAAFGAGLAFELSSGGGAFVLTGSTVSGNQGTGIAALADDGYDGLWVEDSTVEGNDADGIELAALTGAGMSFYGYGASTERAGCLANGGYGLRIDCGPSGTGDCYASTSAWDMGEDGTADDNALGDVYSFRGGVYTYATDAAFSCNRTSCF